MELSNDDVPFFMVGTIGIVILFIVGLVGMFNYGYYQGRSNVLESYTCTHKEKTP